MHTRTYSAPRPPRPPLERSTAWGCVVANLTVPGLGSIIAGRRAGWVQLVLSQTGFVLTLGWAVAFVAKWLKTKAMPVEADGFLAMGAGGAILFLAMWAWSLASSLQILREARTTGA
jgi:hypothetical protein